MPPEVKSKNDFIPINQIDPNFNPHKDKVNINYKGLIIIILIIVFLIILGTIIKDPKGTYDYLTTIVYNILYR